MIKDIETLKQMSDEELNRLSAVQVMKWRLETRSGYVDNNWVTDNGLRHIKDWNPTGDMNDAVKLIDTLHKQDWILRELRHYIDEMGMGVFNRYHCLLMQVETGATRSYTDKVNFSRSITIAAILSKGEDKD